MATPVAFSRKTSATLNLEDSLGPLQPLLDDPCLTNCFINGVGDGKVFIERGKGVEQISLPFTFRALDDIARNAAAMTGQDIGEDMPIVEAQFPPYHRVHILRHPAVPEGTISFSIRRPSLRTVHPDELEGMGVFQDAVAEMKEEPPYVQQLHDYYGRRQWKSFLWTAVENGVCLMFSGEPDTGKTFNMRSFTFAIPKFRRVLTIEDTRELLDLPCLNVVHMLYSARGQSAAKITAVQLVEAAMRMGVEAMLVQELRDANGAFSFLSALQAGCWGMATTHAESAEDAYERVAGLIRQHEIGRLWDDAAVMNTLRKCIPIVVHCVKQADGRRRIRQVLWRPGMERSPG